jgi:hypothetical protein
MSNRISGILFITLIALCAIIVIEARMGIPSVDNLKATVNEYKAATPAGPLRLTLPPLAALGETVERPLFSQIRRPPQEDLNAASVTPAPVPIGSIANFSVSAIVITEDESAVLLNHPQSGELTRVAEGEAIAGWRLERVEKDRAIFSKDGETREAVLRSFGPPPLPRPRPKTLAAPRADSSERALRRTLSEAQRNLPQNPFSSQEKRAPER